LNCDIVVEMFTVKEAVLSPAGTPAAAGEEAGADEAGAEEAGADVAGVEELDELDEVDDEQPAAARASTPATATQPSRGKRLPPALVLPSRTPTPFEIS
jgi:hypothetical protein